MCTVTLDGSSNQEISPLIGDFFNSIDPDRNFVFEEELDGISLCLRDRSRTCYPDRCCDGKSRECRRWDLPSRNARPRPARKIEPFGQIIFGPFRPLIVPPKCSIPALPERKGE